MKKFAFILMFCCLSAMATDLGVSQVSRDFAANDMPSVWRLYGHLTGEPLEINLYALSPADEPMLFEVEVHSELGSHYVTAEVEGDLQVVVPAEFVGQHTAIVVFDQNHSGRCNTPSNCIPKVIYEYDIRVVQDTPQHQMLDCSAELWTVEDAQDPAVFTIVDSYYPTNPYNACHLAQGSDLSTDVVGSVSVAASLPAGTELVNLNLAAFCVTEPLSPDSDYQGNIQVYIKDAANPWGWSFAGQFDLNYNDPNNGQLRVVELDAYISSLVLNGEVDLRIRFNGLYADSEYYYDAVSFSAR